MRGIEERDLERNMTAEPGLNPTMPKNSRSLVGISPLGPLVGQKKTEKSKDQTLFPEASEEFDPDDSESITACLTGKAQFLIAQNMQNRSLDSNVMPITPRQQISYSQGLKRKSYMNR